MLTGEVRIGVIVCFVVSALVGAGFFASWRFQTKDQEYNAGFGDLGPLISGFAFGGSFLILISALAIAITIRGCLSVP